jgi:hypothetical protein
MRHAPFVLTAAAMLSACGSDDSVELENASANEVAQELRKAEVTEGFVNPGKWKQTVKLLEMNSPGMRPEMAEAMKRATGQTQVHESCLTAEQASRPREDFFTGAGKNCRYEHFNWGDGKIDLKLNCTEDQGVQSMELVGTYKPDSYQMAMTANTKGMSAGQTMTMKMQVDAERIGECTAKQS